MDSQRCHHNTIYHAPLARPRRPPRCIHLPPPPAGPRNQFPECRGTHQSGLPIWVLHSSQTSHYRRTEPLASSQHLLLQTPGKAVTLLLSDWRTMCRPDNAYYETSSSARTSSTYSVGKTHLPLLSHTPACSSMFTALSGSYKAHHGTTQDATQRFYRVKAQNSRRGGLMLLFSPDAMVANGTGVSVSRMFHGAGGGGPRWSCSASLRGTASCKVPCTAGSTLLNALCSGRQSASKVS